MQLRITLGLAALLLSGCRTHIIGGVYDDADVKPPDMVRQFDLSQIPDIAHPVDLAQKSCGQIMKCVIADCGGMLGQCQLQCFQGASPQGLQQAGALLACIVQNCIAGQQDGGQSLPLCVIGKCGNEVQGCDGFGF